MEYWCGKKCLLKCIQILAYADETDIIDLRLSYVVKAYQKIEQMVENLKLQINKAQTKLMMAYEKVG